MSKKAAKKKTPPDATTDEHHISIVGVTTLVASLTVRHSYPGSQDRRDSDAGFERHTGIRGDRRMKLFYSNIEKDQIDSIGQLQMFQQKIELCWWMCSDLHLQRIEWPDPLMLR
jgi:hypothetical protein